MIRMYPEPDLPELSDKIGFFIELQNGKVSELRFATVADLSVAKTILTADASIWKNLILKKEEPVSLLLNGQIKVDKGNLLTLITQKDTAREILQAAHKASSISTAEKAKSLSENIAQPTQKEFIQRTNFVTSGRGIDMDSIPIQLFKEAKEMNTWDPADISFQDDIHHWRSFNRFQKKTLMHLCTLVMAGQGTATLELAPLMKSLARDDQLELEIYLTSFIWEKAKHTDFFSRLRHTLKEDKTDLSRLHGHAFKELYQNKLPEALLRLNRNPIPANQLKATVIYILIAEATLAETVYEGCNRTFQKQNRIPGLLKGIRYLKQDNSRHIAFGVYFLNKLLSEHPALMDLFETETKKLFELAKNVIHEIFNYHNPMPFNLHEEWFISYASSQLEKRMASIKEQKNATM